MLFIFRFDADRAPVSGNVLLGLFRPGVVTGVSGLTEVPTVPPPCPGDADGNRVIDFGDVTAVLTNWGGPGPLGDADLQGGVTFADMTAVFTHWGEVCP